MLSRILEPEVMDSPEEAGDYDAMDHSEVNRVFVADFLSSGSDVRCVLDVGAGTAQIPIELCRQSESAFVIAVDLAEHMLRVSEDNVARAGLAVRIDLQKIDAKRMPFPDGRFSAVMSNSIVHHIPLPQSVFCEIVRVAEPGAVLFVRDLLRPPDDETVRQLVQTYAGNDNDHQRKMFEDSLRAALTVEEIRQIVVDLGFPPDSVQQSTDRHWTWTAWKGNHRPLS